MISTHLSQKDYQSVFTFCNNFQLALILIEKDFSIIEINSVAQMLFNHCGAQWKHSNLHDLCEKNGITCPYSMSSLNQQPFASTELNTTTHVLYDARIVDVHWCIASYLDDDENLLGYLLVGKMQTSLDNFTKDQKRKSLQKLIANIPGSVYCKDLQGRYIQSNEHMAHIGGYPSAALVLNHTDDDMSWFAVANDLRAADKKAVEEKSTIFTEEYPLLVDGSQAIMLSTKSPLYDESGAVVGIIGTSFNVANVRQQSSETTENDASDLLAKNDDNFHFTAREIECINWMIKGKTSLEIAMILNLSERTVETHINNIKKKTKCYKQFQLGYILGKNGTLIV